MRLSIKIVTILILCFSIESIQAQKLGMSSISSIGFQQSVDDCRIYGNIGEPIINHTDNEVSIYNGILQQHNTLLSRYANLVVKYYFDINQNGEKDAGEYFVNLGRFSVNEQIFQNINSEGVIIYALPGIYIVKNESWTNDNWILTSEPEVEVTFNEEESAEVLFGVTTLNEGSSFSINLTSSPVICNRDVLFYYHIENTGSIEEPGIAWIEMDETFSEFYYFEDPDFISADSLTFGWNFELPAFQSRQIKFRAKAPSVEDIALGVVLEIDAWLEVQNGIEFYYTEDFLCSYDPNDKTVITDREDELALIDEPLYYRIRFQNTGNYYAQDVIIRDTISEFLDVTTFILMSTSHPDHLQIIHNRENLHQLEFAFEDIMLPDSLRNEPGSHGFIYYSVEANQEIPEETEISNTAHIYFDDNPPIVTNTTGSIMVEEFPIINRVSKHEWHKLDIELYPNPASETVTLSKEVSELGIYTFEGKLVKQVYDIKKFNVKDLNPGLFVLKLSKGSSQVYKKLIVVK